MALRTGSRDQLSLFPKSLEDSVDLNDPVRAFDAMIDVLDPIALGLYINPNKAGNPSYNPIAMLKLLVYSYSYGWRSSRKIERATHHNISFIWLMAGLKPDHKTISTFRKKNKKVLKNVLKETAKICLKLDLIEGNTLFVDGTKMRGSCSISKTYDKETLERMSSHIDKNIEELLKECMKIDKEENGSLIAMNKKLAGKESLQKHIKEVLEEMKVRKIDKVNLTDPDAVNFSGRQGSHAGYNAQVVTDKKHGLIVSADVVAENNDLNQFSRQIQLANDTLGKDCTTAVADAGYSKIDNLKHTVNKQIDVIVPTQKQAAHNPQPIGDFDKDNFIFNKEKDCYICPFGQELGRKTFNKTRNVYVYKISETKNCRNCTEYGNCTKSKQGRVVNRHTEEEMKIKLKKRYDSDEGKAIYDRRKEVAELPFGHIKYNLGARNFLIRGIDGANAEFSIFGSCFNITRMITLLGGVSSFITKLQLI